MCKQPWLRMLPLALLLGCQPDTQPTETQVGADRDAHGCIPSAGYAWCARTDRCERPWDLAREHAFENTRQAFEAFCRVPEEDARQPG